GGGVGAGPDRRRRAGAARIDRPMDGRSSRHPPPSSGSPGIATLFLVDEGPPLMNANDFDSGLHEPNGHSHDHDHDHDHEAEEALAEEALEEALELDTQSQIFL